MLGAKPSEHEACYKRPAADAQAQRDFPYVYGQRPEQSADEYSKAYEHEVCFRSPAVGVAYFFGSRVDFPLKPDNGYHVTAPYLYLSEHRYRHSSAAYALYCHTIHIFLPAEFIDSDAGQSLRSDGYVDVLGHEISQCGILNFRPDPALIADYELTASAEHDFVALGYFNVKSGSYIVDFPV